VYPYRWKFEEVAKGPSNLNNDEACDHFCARTRRISELKPPKTYSVYSSLLTKACSPTLLLEFAADARISTVNDTVPGMPVDALAEMLAAKYDLIYQRDALGEQVEQDPNSLRPELVRVKGWPADRWQALVFLARPGDRLLEIGCGVGHLLATLAPHFDEVIGTELSPIRAERARHALAHLPNCRIFNEPLESLADTLDPPSDCIIWADVLEHIIDVIGAMHILAGLSRPGTQLVTVTDNIAFLAQRLNLLRGRARHCLGCLPQ